MKIGIHFPPRFAQRPPQEGGAGGETDPRGVGGFEQLLEAMRLAMENPDGRAAALEPKIGSHSRAFDKARLLVETSLDLPRLEAPAGHYESSRQITEQREEIVAKVRKLLEHLAAHFASHVEHHAMNDQQQTAPVGELITTNPGSTSERHLAVRLPQVAFPLPSAPALHAQAEATSRLAFDPARASSRIPAAKGLASAPPDTGSGQHSRFAAQLLAAEGGLRVMLRLPRLSENERSELEARLGLLLESFGHRRREIVIQEIATA